MFFYLSRQFNCAHAFLLSFSLQIIAEIPQSSSTATFPQSSNFKQILTTTLNCTYTTKLHSIKQTFQFHLISITRFQEAPTLHLRLHKPKNQKKVQWTATTVDNEHMDKKKSKCCCVYVKPKTFGESSSESEDECEHCTGHVEMKKKKGDEQGEPGGSGGPS
jgi:protein phosphatase 1 regulatory subunit 11